MCGRYSLALNPRQVRQRLVEQSRMPVHEVPEEDDATRSSYNVGPGYIEPVYRAIKNQPGKNSAKRSESGAESRLETGQEKNRERGQSEEDRIKYILQPMKWGLIPSWTKKSPDYASLLRTINCRDDSLLQDKGMWTSIKKTKRCIIPVEGFFEWLKKSVPSVSAKEKIEKIPHFIKRKDGQLMLLAGLWDCVELEDGGKQYTYTIITTDANEQVSKLHDRMPVIFESASEEARKWLDPERRGWDSELQGLLKPYEGELEVYRVPKEVGKVGNNDPSFVRPAEEKESKASIKNWFAGKGKKEETKKEDKDEIDENEKREQDSSPYFKYETTKQHLQDIIEGDKPKIKVEAENVEDNTLLPIAEEAENEFKRKREREQTPPVYPEHGPKVQKMTASPSPRKNLRSAMHNSPRKGPKSPMKPKRDGNAKITSFFKK